MQEVGDLSSKQISQEEPIEHLLKGAFGVRGSWAKSVPFKLSPKTTWALQLAGQDLPSS